MKKTFPILLAVPLILVACQKAPVVETPLPEAPKTTSSAVLPVENVSTVQSGATDKLKTDVVKPNPKEKILDTGMTESEILAKIEENTKKQQEIEKSSTGVLVQGDYRAELVYDSNDFLIAIRIQAPWKEEKFPFSKEILEKNRKIQELYDNGSCKNSEDSTECEKTYIFLKTFFGDGRYLAYEISSNCCAPESIVFMDTATWKVIYKALLDESDDYPQVCEASSVYLVCLMGNRLISHIGLIGIMNWKIIETIYSQNEWQLWGMHVDDDYLYSTNEYYENSKLVKRHLIIYNLKTLKEVYSKEIK